MADSSSSGDGGGASSSPTTKSSSWSLRDAASSAEQLVQWKQPKKSAAAFAASLMVLVSVATLSAISVASYLLLTCLCITITFRVYKAVTQALSKAQQGHPFRSLLDRDISVSPEWAQKVAEESVIHVNWFCCQTRRLLLVEDLVDSLKLAALVWVMTYVGAVFNLLTLLILADVLCFTAPLVYQKKKTQIDQHVHLIRSRVEEMLHRLQDRLPGAVKRGKAE